MYIYLPTFNYSEIRQSFIPGSARIFKDDPKKSDDRRGRPEDILNISLSQLQVVASTFSFYN